MTLRPKMAEPVPVIFFWGRGKYGWCSQWSSSPFVEENEEKEEEEGEEKKGYQNCEEYMMKKKAELFEDRATLRKMNRTSDPKTLKRLGRQVRGFKPKIWDQFKVEIVTQGNYLKFTQNPDLKAKLLATGEAYLVEASPFDRVWGIGYTAKDAMAHVSTWGENKLGAALVAVRTRIRKEEEVAKVAAKGAAGAE